MTERSRRPRPRVLAVTLAIGAALTVAGCSSGSGSAGSGSGVGAATNGSGGEASAGPAPAGSAVPGSAAKTIASTTFAVAGKPNDTGGTLRVGLVGLRVDGRLATLDVTFTPHFPGETPDQKLSLYQIFGNQSPDVTLVDNAALKRYVVVRDSAYHYLQTDSVNTQTTNNTAVGASYTFAAPVDSVRVVDIYIDDRKVFANVSVSR